MDVGLLPDHGVVLVVGVVGVAQLTVGPELELEELVSELALVADVIAEVELVGHLDKVDDLPKNADVVFRNEK